MSTRCNQLKSHHLFLQVRKETTLVQVTEREGKKQIQTISSHVRGGADNCDAYGIQGIAPKEFPMLDAQKIEHRLWLMRASFALRFDVAGAISDGDADRSDIQKMLERDHERCRKKPQGRPSAQLSDKAKSGTRPRLKTLAVTSDLCMPETIAPWERELLLPVVERVLEDILIAALDGDTNDK